MKATGPRAQLAPCQVACPAGTDAGRYVGLIAAKRYDEAYAVAAEVNPFPSVCGWICTAPCESACRRGVLDEPIAIRTLKRFAAEHGSLPPVDPPSIRRTEKVGIVGGGPAGMSAAYYLARLGLPGHGLRGDAGARRDDGHRDPVVPAAARRPPGRDRPDHRARRGSPAERGDGPRLHARRPRAPGLPRRLPRDRRLEEPPARRPRRRRRAGRARHAVPQAGQPRRGAAPQRSAPSSSAVAARRWTPRGRPGAAAPLR